MEMNKKIIFSAGGTGGHIIPAVNIMKHFFDGGYKVKLVTDLRGRNFVKDFSKFEFYIVNSGTPTNKNFIMKILSIFKVLFSIIKSIYILKKERADLVFGLGGYVSFPISFASKFLGIPLVIYENNLVLGRANKILLSHAKKIFTAKKIEKNFPKKHEEKIINVGTILDKKIINNKILKKKYNADNISILVLGGSQGAEIFGKVVPSVMKMISREGYNLEINHQCITEQKNLILDFYKKNNIKNNVFEFREDILNLILSSDFAITRCGASTTAELVHLQTPFIAIPLPNSIDDHQHLNGKYYEELGCCWFLNQANFDSKNLYNLVIDIINNKNKLENVQKNMKKNYNIDVYQKIEKEIESIIKQ